MCDFLEEIARHKTVSAHFLEEIACHKTVSAHFLEEIARHKTISAHFLRKSAATYSLISSGNRPPQTFSAHFLRKSAATKLFRLISSGNRSPRNCFGSFPQEIGRSLTHSFPQEIACQELLHFLRKSAAKNLFISSGNRPPLTHSFPGGNRRMAYIELTLFLRRTHVSVDAHGKAPF